MTDDIANNYMSIEFLITKNLCLYMRAHCKHIILVSLWQSDGILLPPSVGYPEETWSPHDTWLSSEPGPGVTGQLADTAVG